MKGSSFEGIGGFIIFTSCIYSHGVQHLSKCAALVGILLLITVGIHAQKSEQQMRLTPGEILGIVPVNAGAGTSGVNGIQTRVLHGDPTKAGLYTIQLTIPANTTIKAHTHPDDRIATVISGTWHIGYGAKFDENKVKALTPGSFYTEPPGIEHFARTGKQPVVVQITGYGPTGTEYVEK